MKTKSKKKQQKKNLEPKNLVKFFQVIMILSYFGGLRHVELNSLSIEMVEKKPDGLYVTHSRAKQRTDKRSSKFLVPSNGDVDYAQVVDKYISDIKAKLGKFSGRIFYTGTPVMYINTPMGKNTISSVPKELASLLGKENPGSFTFHSLRRTAATSAADNGASAHHMMDFFGWSNPKMPQEYISTSNASIRDMANRLQGDVQATSIGASPSTVDTAASSGFNSHIDASGQFQPPKQSLLGEGPQSCLNPSKNVIYIQQFNGTLNL